MSTLFNNREMDTLQNKNIRENMPLSNEVDAQKQDMQDLFGNAGVSSSVRLQKCGTARKRVQI
jgi:hypothetical protein